MRERTDKRKIFKYTLIFQGNTLISRFWLEFDFQLLFIAHNGDINIQETIMHNRQCC